MSRRSRRNGDSRNISMISIGVMILLIVAALVLSYFLFRGVFRGQAQTQINNTQKIATSDSGMLNMITNTENSQAVSSTIGKSVNELENEENSNVENTTKMAVNTSKVEEKVTESKESENKQVNEQTNTEVEEEKTADPTFAKPVEGEIIKDYSKDNLIYSNTLEEWTTHLGIDFASEKTDVVKAAADGKIKSIKNDPRYGLTVVIEHTNGFETIYSSLLTAEFITVGEEVKQGQTIATVGNTATFEIADETHLHFEMKKDGENVDPNIYLK
ncbi:MAG: peptidoglycan DD-metalloendopeptidase family protein [Clostridia bacterium]